MGSKQSKWANDYASIFINMPKDQHFAGETVQGCVEILVKQPFNVNSLDLILVGKEKT